MIRHIVMWKLKDFAEGKSKEENAKIIKHELESLKEKIAEIINIEVGINVIEGDAAFDIVLNSDFNSANDLKAYQLNPLHVKVSEYVGKVKTDRVVVDYEIK